MQTRYYIEGKEVLILRKHIEECFSQDLIPFHFEFLTSIYEKINSLSSSIFQKLTDGFQVYRVYLKYNIFKSLICLFVLSVNSILR